MAVGRLGVSDWPKANSLLNVQVGVPEVEVGGVLVGLGESEHCVSFGRYIDILRHSDAILVNGGFYIICKIIYLRR